MAALTIGELVGFIDIEDKGFGKGLNAAGKGLDKLQAETTGSMSSIESTVSSALSKIEQEIADGLDPAKAIANLDKLEKALDDGLAEMLDEADAFAAELDKAIDDAFDDLDDKARRGGEDAAKGLGDGLDGAGKSQLPAIGGGFMTVLKGLGWAAAGAAIGQMLMAGLSSAMDAEDAKAKLFAQLGTTPAQSERIGKVAGKVYADAYGESMSDVTDAIKSVVQNIDGMRGASEASLTAVSKRAMDVATVMDEDVGAVTRAVSQMLRTGLAPSAEAAFDVLARGAQLGADKSQDLLDTFNEYSTQFRDLGLNADQALGLMVQGLKAGARDSDTVADALKELNIRVQDMTAAPALKELGLNAKDMAAAFGEGGAKASGALDTILDRLRAVKDPTERYALAQQILGTKSEDLAKALLGMDPSAAVGALGKVDGAAKTAGDTLHDTASNKLEAFKRGLQANVVDFLGGTVLPAVEEFADKFDFSAIGDKIGPIVEKVKSFFGGMFESIQGWIDKNRDKIQGWVDKFETGFQAMSDTVGAVLDVIKGLWDLFGDDLLNILGILVDTFLGIWSGLWEALKGVWETFAGIFTGDWKRAWEGVKSIFSGVWNAVKSILVGALELVKAQISKAWNAATELTSKAWNALKDAVSKAIDNVIDFVKKLPGKILTGLGNLGKLLVKSGKDMITGLWSGIQAMAGWIKDKVTGFFGGLLPDWVKSAIDAHSPSKVFAELGKWTIQGFVVGMQGEQGKAKTTVDNLVAMVKGAFKQSPGAPDALVDWVGKETDRLQTIAKKREQIIQAIADAKKYADDIAKQAADFANLSNLGLGEGAGAGDIISGLQSKLSALTRFADDIKKLAAKGLNKTILRQIIEAGPDKGLDLAEMLVGADGSEIKAINKAQAKIDKVSKQMGKNSADALYDTGKQAGKGFLRGLEGQLKEMESMMAKIAKAVVAAVKKELKVASPSRVFMEIGDNTMLGFIEGVLGQSTAATAAAAGVVGQAVAAAASVPAPGVPSPIYGPSAAPAYGAEYGQAASGGVTVNMYDAVIREEADIGRLGAEFGFELTARG
ncbi:phage tail tape measure protein [Microtetraspora niveoalba]|uniref:phage tail tape measure protein n=1 Tax=Microtetraspora niveoalba TaxID=46175 RepID=UPI0008306348|nr:phage tail tape measure protein [Microtetraspora niveoalba]